MHHVIHICVSVLYILPDDVDHMSLDDRFSVRDIIRHVNDDRSDFFKEETRRFSGGELPLQMRLHIEVHHVFVHVFWNTV